MAPVGCKTHNNSLFAVATVTVASLLGACANPTSIGTPTRFCLPRAGAALAQSANAEENKALNITNGFSAGQSDSMERSTVGLQVIFVLANGSGRVSRTCTGVVVARNIIITAAHCFNKPKLPVSRTLTGVTINPSLFNASATDIVGISKYVVHPGYNGAFHDIAVAQLGGDLPPQVEEATFVSDLSTLVKSLPVVLIGYGITADNSKDDGVKRRTESTLDLMINPQNFPNTDIVNQVRVYDSGGMVRGACNGDSGGPGFVKQSGKVFGIVQGINSTVQPLKNMNCAAGDANYTLIAPYQAWIEQTANIKLSNDSITSDTRHRSQSGNITSQSTANAAAQFTQGQLTYCE